MSVGNVVTRTPRFRPNERVTSVRLPADTSTESKRSSVPPMSVVFTPIQAMALGSEA
jgi:hypothetical protein